jgi:hypothetical protein
MLGSISNLGWNFDAAFKLLGKLHICVHICHPIKFVICAGTGNFDYNLKSGQTFRPFFVLRIQATSE